MTLPLAHHHGFKCAGSSVVHLLNRNWKGKVLHIEHRVADRRIHCEQIRDCVSKKHVALTSHLLTMPREHEVLAHVHFGLVRDPIARLVSAYKFVPEDRRGGDFAGFVRMHQHHACEFHARHLAVPGDDREPWAAAPDAVPVGAPHVLLGVVERFADTMFLLERRLAKVGVEFDGSVGSRQNVGSGEGPDLDDATLAELKELNAADYALHARAGEAMDRELAEVDPDGSGRAEHLMRCERRAGKKEPYLGLGPAHWEYLED